MGKSPTLLLLIGCVACFFPAAAHAYVDPGSGYLITQLVLAAAIGALFYVKKAFRAITQLRKKIVKPRARAKARRSKRRKAA